MKAQGELGWCCRAQGWVSQTFPNQRGRDEREGQGKAGGQTHCPRTQSRVRAQPSPASRASVGRAGNPALNMKREIRVQQEFQLVHNASTGWVWSQGSGAESVELNMG